MAHAEELLIVSQDSGIDVPKGPCLDSAEEDGCVRLQYFEVMHSCGLLQDSDSDVQGPGTSSAEKDDCTV